MEEATGADQGLPPTPEIRHSPTRWLPQSFPPSQLTGLWFDVGDQRAGTTRNGNIGMLHDRVT